MTATDRTEPTTLATTTVEIAREIDERTGTGRTIEIEAQVIDYGPEWADHEYEPQDRFEYTTQSYLVGYRHHVTEYRNARGNTESSWFDTPPAATPDELATIVRGEIAEYGDDNRDPFTGEEIA